MAKKEQKSEKKRVIPPTPALTFLIGFFIFAAILSPAGVLLSFIIKLNQTLGIKIIYSLSAGCFMGLALAIIPAFIFMRIAMKKIKKY
jgi:hypothetical protein